MSSKPTPEIILTHFDWSLARLKEAIKNENTEYYRGAALQRFRLTYDVALETIRAFAIESEQVCSTDESCLRWVEKKQWLVKNAEWKVMIKHYKKIKNQPKDNELDEIYIELKTYYSLLKYLSECMKLADV